MFYLGAVLGIASAASRVCLTLFDLRIRCGATPHTVITGGAIDIAPKLRNLADVVATMNREQKDGDGGFRWGPICSRRHALYGLHSRRLETLYKVQNSSSSAFSIQSRTQSYLFDRLHIPHLLAGRSVDPHTYKCKIKVQRRANEGQQLTYLDFASAGRAQHKIRRRAP